MECVQEAAGTRVQLLACAVPVLDGQESMLHEAGRVDVYMCTFKRGLQQHATVTLRKTVVGEQNAQPKFLRPLAVNMTMLPLRCLL